MAQSHCEEFIHSVDECTLSAGWPPTLRPSQPTWASNPLTIELSATVCIHHRHLLLLLSQKLIFYYPIEGGRLNRPRHCTKVWPSMPMTAYYSCCCDKRTATVSLVTTRLLRPLYFCVCRYRIWWCMSTAVNWSSLSLSTAQSAMCLESLTNLSYRWSSWRVTSMATTSCSVCWSTVSHMKGPRLLTNCVEISHSSVNTSLPGL